MDLLDVSSASHASHASGEDQTAGPGLGNLQQAALKRISFTLAKVVQDTESWNGVMLRSEDSTVCLTEA